MKKFFSLFLLSTLIPIGIFAQTRMLTIDEATGMNPKLSPATLSQLQWLPATGQFVFVVKNCLVRGSAQTSVRDTLVRLTDMNLLLRIGKQDTLKRFPSVTFTSADDFYFTTANKLFLCEIMKNTVSLVNSWPEKSENQDIEKITKRVAYTRDNNLYLATDGKETAITAEKNPGILYGSNRVHRNEFGIEKGTFWSPNGNSLAFYRMDETMVAEYPLVDISSRIATVNPTKYPMAGMTSHKVMVGVYSVKQGTVIYLQSDSSGITIPLHRTEYLTNVTWSPDEKYIFIAGLNRDQNFMQLNMFDAQTGRFVKTLFEEKNEAYVEPCTALYF